MNVAEYVASEAWLMSKARYRAALDRLQVCFICGTKETELHHRSYKRMGCEELDDLVPLCRDHHWEVEKLVKWHGVPRWDAHIAYRTRLDARTDHAPKQLREVVFSWLLKVRPAGAFEGVD